MGEYANLPAEIQRLCRSEIRKLCREFDDKLPSKMSELKTLPAYAEKLILRYPSAEKASKREIENQLIIWNGFFSIYEDTCKTLNVGYEIGERGHRLYTTVVDYLKSIHENIRPDDHREDYLRWLFDWLSGLDVSKLDTHKLSDKSISTLSRIQKTVNDVVNDLMASCTNNDLTTANSINVYRDEDILIDLRSSYFGYLSYLEHKSPSESKNLNAAIKGTEFVEETLSANLQKLIHIASGMKVNGDIIK